MAHKEWVSVCKKAGFAHGRVGKQVSVCKKGGICTREG